jgi:alginate O-acetyltransferase complex protein AlgI
MEVEFIEEPGLLRYCNYILFFPLILAGPIERYRRFETQMTQPQWNPDLVMPALHRIANGMIKKFVIADNLSVFGILAFDNPMDMSVPVLWLGVMSQLLLIYLDFSGYCDIVIGLAMLMGFRVVENFNRPFHSTNIQEFWERWHMSLSSLVKDYIFTPINVYVFKNVRRQYQFALVVASYFFSMVLIAMWHGTTVGFLVFGILHGGALALSQAYKKIFKASAAAGQGPNVATVYAKRLMVYSFVSVSLTLWLTSASEWGGIFGRMLGFR